MNKLDLDISKYSPDQLCEIFNIPSIINSDQITGHMSNYKTTVLNDNNLDIAEKDNIVKFLDNVVTKLTSLDEILTSNYHESALSFHKPISDKDCMTTSIILPPPPCAPYSHPLIMNPNTLAAMTTMSAMQPTSTPERSMQGTSSESTKESKGIIKAIHSLQNVIEKLDKMMAMSQFSNGRSAGSAETPPGYMNPIDIRTMRYTFYLDSSIGHIVSPLTISGEDAQMSNSANFTVNLPDNLQNVVKYRLNAFQIPLTAYAINKVYGNNHFMVDGICVDISYGNYTTPFTALNYQDASAAILYNIQEALINNGVTDISYNIDPISGKSKFTNNSGSSSYTIYFDVSFSHPCQLIPLGSTLGYLLGFRKSSITLGIGDTVFSTGIVSINIPKYIYICINDFTGSSLNNNRVIRSSSIEAPYILACIPYQDLVQNEGVYNFGQQDDTLNAFREFMGPTKITKLTLQILDDHMNLIDLNGMNWFCALDFDVLHT